MRALAAAWVGCLALSGTGASLQAGPLAPVEALGAFVALPDLRVELVAAEPLVVDPVAIAFAEDGRLFAAENRDYPQGPSAGGSPGGMIALFEDTDGDGACDRRTTYAAGLTFPNGVLPWRGGVVVTCAPEILYLKDADGDGRADERRVLVTGFSTTGSTQLRVSHPTLGPDGWIYVTSGLTGGELRFPERPDRPAIKTTTDVRFRPESFALEAAGGRGQFGLSFDDFGRRFVCFNRVQVQHVVLEPDDLSRNPHLAAADGVEDCPELAANPLLRGGGGAARIYPVTAHVTTADSHLGTFTAACAVHVYRGHALPARYRGQVFSCDPTGNLVHADTLVPRGASFAASPLEDGKEVLASRDEWFRPVYLAGGPDGALYVADMYRRTIEHPDYLPVEVRRRTDFDGGKGLGRIWRITSRDAPRGRAGAGIGSRAPQDLAAALESTQGWRRDTAFRLLLEARDPASVAPLRRVANGEHGAEAAAAALRALEALAALDADTLAAGLDARAAPVRETALDILARRPLVDAVFAPRVLGRADDPDARVRFRSALALSSLRGPSAASALASIALRGAGDRWTRAAVLGSAAGREREVLRAVVDLAKASPPPPPELLADIGAVLGAATPPAKLPSLLAEVLEDTEPLGTTSQAAVAAAMAERAALPGLAPGTPRLRTLAGRTESAAVLQTLSVMVSAASAAAGAGATPPADRRRAVTLLAQAGGRDACVALVGLVAHDAPAAPVEIKAAAARALVRLDDQSAIDALLGRAAWEAFGPEVRETVIGGLTEDQRHHPRLLAAVEAGVVSPSALDAARRGRLLEHPDAAVRERAAALFASGAPGDRTKAYEDAKSVLKLAPSPANGRAVFRRACANCHRLDQEGCAVGPDIFDVRNQPKEAILLHLLVPNHEVSPRFAAYTVETTDGRALSGLLVADTPAGVTLRQALGVEEHVPRALVARTRTNGLSLMPDELEKSLTRQELADLLADLKGEGAGASSTEPRPAESGERRP